MAEENATFYEANMGTRTLETLKKLHLEGYGLYRLRQNSLS
jgi:hypothetical protein